MDSEIEIALRIYHAVRFMNQRNRTVGSAYGTELGLVESSVLQELLADPTLTAQELSRRLCLYPVAICRTIKWLKQAKLLRTRPAKTDRRSRILLLTEEGRRSFFQAYERASQVFGSAYERLGARDGKLYETLFKRFLDTLEAPPSSGLPNDPPLMVEIRRFSRWLGLYGNSLFGIPGLAPLTWQILAKICTQESDVFISDLSTLYGVRQNTLSQLVGRLERDGYVRRLKGSRDKRLAALVATPEGLVRHAAIERHAALEFLRGLEGFSPAERRKFVQLWERYCGVGSAEDEIVLEVRRAVRRLRQPEELSAARTFIYKVRVAQDLLTGLPDQIVSKDSWVFGLYNQDTLEAVLEISRRGRGWELTHLLSEAKPEVSKIFIDRSLEQFFLAGDKGTLSLRSEYYSVEVQRYLGCRGHKDAELSTWGVLKDAVS